MQILNCINNSVFNGDINSDLVLLISVSLVIAVFFVRKNEAVTIKLKHIIIGFICNLVLLFLFDRIFNRLVNHITSDNSFHIGSFYVLLMTWPMIAIAYALVHFNANKYIRTVLACFCLVAVIIVSVYPSLLIIRDFKKYDYVLSGSYTTDKTDNRLDAAFEDKTLVIGKKGSGELIDSFDVKLSESDELDVSLAYRAHIQNIGWYEWSSEETTIAYYERHYGMDLVQFMLYGKDALKYDIEYRVVFIGGDWQEWKSNGLGAGIVDGGSLIESIEIRLIRTGNDAPNKWTITQFTDDSYDENACYTIRNNEDGTLIMVDGGGVTFDAQARSIINLFGGRVDYWFITRSYYGFAGVYYSVMEYPNGIEVGEVYDSSSCSLESFEIDGLRIDFFDAYAELDDGSNYGSLMFKISGQTDSILFLGDAYGQMHNELINQYGNSALTASYIEVANLSSSSMDVQSINELNPQAVFIDAPLYMIRDSGYVAGDIFRWCNENGIIVYNQCEAPTIVSLD